MMTAPTTSCQVVGVSSMLQLLGLRGRRPPGGQCKGICCSVYSSRAGWCWAPSWVVAQLVVLRLVGWSLGGFWLKNQSQKAFARPGRALCGHTVARECVGYRPTTTQPPITAQLARRWVVLGGSKTTQQACNEALAWPAWLASSGLVWAVKKPPNTTQTAPARAWPGARSSLGLVVFVCRYKPPKPPSAQLVHAPGRPGRDQVHLVKSICAAWS